MPDYACCKAGVSAPKGRMVLICADVADFAPMECILDAKVFLLDYKNLWIGMHTYMIFVLYVWKMNPKD